MIKHNFDEVMEDFDRELKEAQHNINNTGGEIILEAYRLIVLRSPLNKGRYRASHFLTINTSTARETKEGANFEAAINKNLADASNKMQKFDFSKMKFIQIQNNLEYALPLENGSSDQAPHGVYGITSELIKRKLV